MNLKDFFEQHHKGKGKAIKRKKLLPKLRKEIDPEFKDRDMRKDYEFLPLCGDSDGLYFAATEEERKKQIARFEGKIRKYIEKIERLKKYPINGQMDLF